MAEAQSFSPEELSVLQDAARQGKLSDAQKQEIVRRSSTQDNEFAPIPEVQRPELAPDTRAASINEFTSGFVGRGTAEAVGGMTGAALALPGAPLLGPAALLALIAGGVLGAAAGSTAFDAIENFLKGEGVLQGEPVGLERVVEGATDAAYWDAAFGGGASLIRPVLGARRVIGKMAGLFNRETDSLIAKAQERGIQVGAAEVGGSVPKGFLRTVSVFPFAAGPAAKAQVGKQAQVLEAVDRMLNDLAPNATLASDIGVDMAKAAKGTSNEFRRVSGVLFDRFRDLAANASKKDIIPTERVATTARELFGEITEGAIKVDGKVLKTPKGDALANFEKFIGDLQKLPDAITMPQYRRLTKDLNDTLFALKTEGADVRQAGLLKKGLEEDLNNIRIAELPPGEGQALKDALLTANKWYSKGIVHFSTPTGKGTIKTTVPEGFKGKETFETPTAAKFKRTDKNFFEPGGSSSGTINEDELFAVALKLKSPEAVADLASLIGPKTMKKVARRRLESAFEKSLVPTKIGSIEDTILDPHLFEKELGLAGRAKDANAGLDALLRSGGLKLDDVKELIEVAKSIENLGDPSTFVRRRAILGGAGAVVTGAAGFGGAAVGGAKKGLGVASSILTAGGVTLLTRNFSRIFSDPKALKNMITALDKARDTTARQAAFGRVLNFVTRKDDDNTEVGN